MVNPFWIYGVFIVIFGLCVGSFLNVVIFRLREKTSVVRGRSCCRSCKTPVAILDLIPVISFLRLKGRCRSCSEVIEWQYPAVELITAILFALVFARAYFGFYVPGFVDDADWLLLFIRDAITVSALVVIFVYDLRYQYILDRVTLPVMILVFAINISLGANPISLLLAALLIGGFFAVQFLISNGKWIGGGDIRLGMLMGLLLGIGPGLIALFIAYILGSVIGIALMLFKRASSKSRIAFGTFLSVATVISLLLGGPMWEWYLSLLGF